LASNGTSLAENASFDVLIDKIRPVVFARRQEQKSEGDGRYIAYKVTRRYTRTRYTNRPVLRG